MALAQCKISLASGQESTTTASYTSCSTPVSPASGSCNNDRAPLDLPTGGFSFKWRCGQQLAGGDYGRIHRAFNLQTGQIFATKIHSMKESDAEDAITRKNIEDRLAGLEDLHHPNIVEHLGHDIAEANLYIYLEYVPGGSLSAMIQEFGAFREPMLNRAARGLLEGLEYLHTRDVPVVHGHVMSSNILVDEQGRLKLQCFLCSRHVTPDSDYETLESLPWLAPEVLTKQGFDGTKADVWSAGMVIVEMATAEAPWEGYTLDQVLFALTGGLRGSLPLPGGLSADASACVTACLQLEADARPTTSKLLEFDFLAYSQPHGPFCLF